MLSKELEVTLNLAFKDARTKRHELMSVEHLLLSLLDNTSAVTVLKACDADIEKLQKELEEFLEATTPLIPTNETDHETQPTLGFQRGPAKSSVSCPIFWSKRSYRLQCSCRNFQ